MKRILAQIKNGQFKPYSLDDEEKAKDFLENQVVRLDIFGVDKQRSYVQLQRYWVLMKAVAQFQSDHTEQFSAADMDFRVKALVAKEHPSMIKRFEVMGNKVVIEPISISYDNMKHLEACDYFKRADKVVEKITGATPQEIMDNA